MKKHILTLAAAAAFFAPAAHAQGSETDVDDTIVQTEKTRPATRKGNVALGAGVGLANIYYGRTGYGSEEMFSYDVRLSPSVSYFVTDRLMLSGTLLGGASAQATAYENRYRSLNAGLGIEARYYFGKGLKRNGELNRFRPYAEAGVSYMRYWDHQQSSPGQQYYKYNYGAGVAKAGVGFSYFLSPSAAFEAGLIYNRAFEYSYGDMWTSGQLQFHIGGRFFLNRK